MLTTAEAWANRSRVKRWRQCLYEAGVEAGRKHEGGALIGTPLFEFYNTLVRLELRDVYIAFTHAHPLFIDEFTKGFYDGL